MLSDARFDQVTCQRLAIAKANTLLVYGVFNTDSVSARPRPGTPKAQWPDRTATPRILRCMAKKPAADAGTNAKGPGRLKQIRMLAGMLHRSNPKALPIIFASMFGVIALAVVIGLVTGTLLYTLPPGIPTALLVGMILFGQMAQRMQYSMLDGQPGAAAAVLQAMRGNWTVTPAVSGNRDLDVVHRVVGRPGVILVSEGPPTRVGKLLAAEKKRVARVAHEVPIYDMQAGDGDDQVPIKKLQRGLQRLPRNLKKQQVEELNNRLKALPQTMQMPKGPMPKGVRMPKGPRPRSR